MSRGYILASNDLAAVIDTPQTTVNCSISGSVKFSQPEQGSGLKMVIIYLDAGNGTANYTFPKEFTHTPGIIISSAVGASVVTSLSTTAVTVTGVVTTGFIYLK